MTGMDQGPGDHLYFKNDIILVKGVSKTKYPKQVIPRDENIP